MNTVQTCSPLTVYRESLLSVREALDVLGGKWKIPIMIALVAGDKRFRHLQRDVTGITAKVLSRELQKLEENKLVIRKVDEETGTAFYCVTSKCKSLEKVIEGLKQWGDYHRGNIFNRPIKTHPINMSRIRRSGARNGL